MMTQLMLWLFCLSVFTAVWLAVLLDYTPFNLLPGWIVMQYLPIILAALFGLYSVLVIAYRVATFNECKEASEELKKEIIEAEKDLKSKGYKFD